MIGPVAEAEALYVKQLKLRERLAAHAGEFVIWDVGAGGGGERGWRRCGRRAAGRGALRIVSFDRTLEPLRFALAHAAELGFLAGYERPIEQLLGAGRAEFEGAQWELRLGDFPSLLRSKEPLPAPHAILFDGLFAGEEPGDVERAAVCGFVRAARPGAAVRDADLIRGARCCG